MRSKPKQKLNIPMRIAASLTLFILATYSVMPGLYARYTTSSDGSDSARVAQYVFDVTDGSGGNFTVDLSEVEAPGKTKDITFAVSDKNSEVAQKYTISLSDFENLPLTYTLTKGSQDVPLTNGKTDDITFSAGTDETHIYTLTVTWDGSENDCKLSDEIDLVTVSINAEQID